MTDRPAANSLWINLETLLAERLPPVWVQALLGVSGRPGRYGRAIAEYAWPSRRTLADLRARSGLAVVEQGDDSLQTGLRRHLGSGEAAVVAVDSFHLPYRPAHGRVHSGRTVIVRPGSAPGQVSIEDVWPPVWRGTVSLAELGTGRDSAVPLDPVREPVFAGVPVARRWWRAAAPSSPPEEPEAWLAARLADLWRDAVAPDGAVPAAGRLRAFAEAFATDAGASVEIRRRASLILRAELGARTYRLCLIRLAARRLDDGWLARAAADHAVALGQLALARDLLIKSMVLPRPVYDRIIVEACSRGAEAETALVQALEAYAAPPVQAVRHA